LNRVNWKSASMLVLVSLINRLSVSLFFISFGWFYSLFGCRLSSDVILRLDDDEERRLYHHYHHHHYFFLVYIYTRFSSIPEVSFIDKRKWVFSFLEFLFSLLLMGQSIVTLNNNNWIEQLLCKCLITGVESKRKELMLSMYLFVHLYLISNDVAGLDKLVALTNRHCNYNDMFVCI
jgi:hypothetical protein